MAAINVPTKSGNPTHDSDNGQFTSSGKSSTTSLSSNDKLKISKLFGVNHPDITEIKTNLNPTKNLQPQDLNDYLSTNKNVNKNFAYAAYNKIKEYEQIEPTITKKIMSIADSLGGMAVGLDYRMKSLDSAVKRMEKGAAGREHVDVDKALYGVKDLLRYTMCFDDANFEKSVGKAVHDITKDYSLSRVLNTMYDGSLYKGINCLFKDNKGHIFELQFHTPESLKAKDGFLVDLKDKKIYKDNQAKTSHQYYETIRDVKTRAKNGTASAQEIADSKKNNSKLYDLWKNVPNHISINLYQYAQR